jgi:hypothetical protein
VPVRVQWQPNRGLASARNVGLAAAGDGLVWFLDDDLVPAPGLVERHRRAHDPTDPAIVVGACRIPPEIDAPTALREWWDEFFAGMPADGVIDRFDRFTTANASGPARLFTEAGGFDERFVTYGLEDYELAVRLLAAGTTLRFAPDAVAWHPDLPPTSLLVARERDVGRNAARLVGIHPSTLDLVFPPGRIPPPRRLLRRLGLRRPAALAAVSRVAFAVHRLTDARHDRTAHRAEKLARAAAHAAGVAEGDPSGALLDRVLGYGTDVPGGRAGGSRASARASRQPRSRPTSSDQTISR